MDFDKDTANLELAVLCDLPTDEGYWWCATCNREVHPARVTFSETHETCGDCVEWKEPPRNFFAGLDGDRCDEALVDGNLLWKVMCSLAGQGVMLSGRWHAWGQWMWRVEARHGGGGEHAHLMVALYLCARAAGVLKRANAPTGAEGSLPCPAS